MLQSWLNPSILEEQSIPTANCVQQMPTTATNVFYTASHSQNEANMCCDQAE